MTALLDLMVHSGDGSTVADYEALPEVCRRTEIVDGAVAEPTTRLRGLLQGKLFGADPGALEVDLEEPH